MDDIKQWVGRTQRASDWITSNRVDLWHATFDRPVGGVNEGDAVPLGFHWSLAQPIVRESDLGPDGHARRGGFLPPIALPRRLWAGSRVAFHRPLRVGERVERVSEIIAVEEKVGRSSALVFVTVRHRFSGEGGLAVEEEQDLVYRETPSRDAESVGGRTEGVSLEASWQRTVHPTETVLFRFSALTMNSHRIHYDRRYATEVEGYDGLVVHGPLIATLLLELAQTQISAEHVARFHFRAKRPTFDTSDFSLFGAPTDDDGRLMLWSTDNRGVRAVDAEIWPRA